MSKYKIINHYQGMAVTYYQSVCPNCNEVFPPGLPDIIHTDLLYYHGFICSNCKELIENNEGEQERFYKDFIKEINN